jgi:hypothetical protein
LTADFAPKSVHSAGVRKNQPSSHGNSAAIAALRLTRRASLIAALLLSIGLWAALWAAVAILASAVLG